jgi:glycosyltransferase involved in cell wall biosynthesis
VRIAIVYDCLFPWSTGGGERLYRALADRFVAEGHEVTYLTRRQWTARDTPSPPGVSVVAVSGAYDLYDEQGRRRPAAAVRFAVDVLRHLVRNRSAHDAVLVSALPVLNVLAVRLALLGRRVPVCVDWLEVWRPDQWREYSGPVVGRVAAVLQRIGISLSPIASCHARVVAERLRDLGLRTEPVVSPGLLQDHAGSRPALDPSEPPTIIYVGRHIPDKRVEVIPAAVAWARGQVPDLRARILGDGPQREVVRAEVARLGLEDVIELPGFVEQTELDNAVRSGSCLVNPSRREGYGLVVVEACAVGTPVVVVAGEDNAAVELVEPGTNGFVAASTAPEVLGAAIVAAVTGGRALRESTVEWFSKASAERTVTVTARGLLAALAPR